jgi:hypothetical protein
MRKWWKWPFRLLLSVMLGLAILLLPLACTTVVVPPPKPDNSVAVYLVDFGWTCALVLPADSHMIEYAYGDWNYYALGNRDLWSGIRAVAWPTQATLVRRAMKGPPDAESIQRQMTVKIEKIHRIEVDLTRAERLEAKLDATYRTGFDESVESRSSGLTFVPHPQAYHYFHNSNHVVAQWLSELGCEIRGPAFYSRWKVSTREANAAIRRKERSTPAAPTAQNTARGDCNTAVVCRNLPRRS